MYVRGISWKQQMDTLSMGRPIGFWRERILNGTAQSSFTYGAVSNNLKDGPSVRLD